jgi:hypothetical protein
MAWIRWTRRNRQRRVRVLTRQELRAKLFPPDKARIRGQVEFLSHFDNQVCKYVAYRGGVGSGKTWVGAYYCIEKAALNPGVRGFIGANTYPQLWQSTLSGLYEVCAAYSVPIWPKRP